MNNSTTVVIQIGNSDDKLSQKEWSSFISEINCLFGQMESLIEIHFNGGSPFFSPWQNACWILVCNEIIYEKIAEELTVIRTKYKQDSVAITLGETQFI